MKLVEHTILHMDYQWLLGCFEIGRATRKIHRLKHVSDTNERPSIEIYIKFESINGGFYNSVNWYIIQFLPHLVNSTSRHCIIINLFILTNADPAVGERHAAVGDHSLSLPSHWTYTVVAILHVLTRGASVTVMEAQLALVQVWGEREKFVRDSYT